MDFQLESMDEQHDCWNENQLRSHSTALLSSPPDERVRNATLPQRWGKTPPNTARKRASRAPLARSVPSPSHSARMSKIFQNASTSLHADVHTSKPPFSPYRLGVPRVTCPSSRGTDSKNTDANKTAESPPEDNHFSFNDQLPSPLLLRSVVSPNGTRWTTVPMADEPISSGFHSPSFPHHTSTPRLANPQYLNLSKPRRVPLPPRHTKSSPLDPDETKLAQSFQHTSISDVQSWLDGLSDEPSCEMHNYDDSPSVNRLKRGDPNFNYNARDHHDISSLGVYRENMSLSSSNLVNGFPEQLSLAKGANSDSPLSMKSSPSTSAQARRSKIPLTSTPVLVHKPRKCCTSPRPQGRGQISSTLPWGNFTLPPRRRKVRSSSSSPLQRFSPAYYIAQPFKIAEDKSTGISEECRQRTTCQQQVALPGLRDLSPHVTPFRKGRGPKRSRCPSYYDEDLLQ
ncbi:hypothetical protein AJ78_02970 [Emergomyces pasteurianus Ep9510]|uniref:Uncharacterized protein n=1 Tax=Emergomyces pasteurianus Ep9510 TaxID=1447872 RepID=A0A1J9PK95_9EURO|nr:hypothetical protein AJ78_02970 [Emergomyces pasteurianus Ep9510]